MVIELCVEQFWSEIILVISNQTRAARSFDFVITRMISGQIALPSVQLPLFISFIPLTNRVRGPYCKLRTEFFTLIYVRARAINQREKHENL